MAGTGIQLWQKDWRVVVGTKDISGLDIQFRVKKSLKQEPNTCDLRIWGLSPDTRKMLEQGTDGRVVANKLSNKQALAGFTANVQTQTVVPVALEAGYKGGRSQIFLGEMRSAQTVTDGPNVITEMTTGDSDKAILGARLSVSLGPGASVSTALQKLLAAMGVGQGNLPKVLNLLNTTGTAKMYTKGAVLKGSAADRLTDITRSAGLEWSVQDGELQILQLGQPLDGEAVLISENTGMVGSPSCDTKGVLTVTTLMIPNIRPGVKIAMQSRSVNGGFRVISCMYEGDTSEKSNEWLIKCECQRY